MKSSKRPAHYIETGNIGGGYLDSCSEFTGNNQLCERRETKKRAAYLLAILAILYISEKQRDTSRCRKYIEKKRRGIGKYDARGYTFDGLWKAKVIN